MFGTLPKLKQLVNTKQGFEPEQLGSWVHALNFQAVNQSQGLNSGSLTPPTPNSSPTTSKGKTEAVICLRQGVALTHFQAQKPMYSFY